MKRGLAIGALLGMLLSAETAQGAGAWTTLLRPLSYTDLLSEESGDTVWCASLEGGLMRFLPAASGAPLGPANFEVIVREPGGLASNRLTALEFDRQRRLWIGTQGAGVCLLSTDRSRFAVLNIFDGLPSDSVNVIESQGDTMWVGTTGGIALWRNGEIFGRFPDGTGPSPFRSNNITGVARFADDLWVSTTDGVYHSALAGGLESWTVDEAGLPGRTPLGRPTNPIDALATDGTTLVAVDSLGLFRWDGTGRRWIRFSRTGSVRGLWDDRGVLMAASDFGVLRFNGTDWTIVTSQVISVTPRRRNLIVTQRPNGLLVSASADGFCQQPETAGTWACAIPPGPPGPDIRELLLDGSRLYVSTEDQGIGRFDGSTWKYWLPRARLPNQDTTFVIAASPFGWLVDRDGWKWLGSWDNALEKFVERAQRDSFVHAFVPASVCPPACIDQIAAHTFAQCAALDSSGGHWFGMWSPRVEQVAPLGVEYYDAAGNYVRGYGSDDNGGLRDGYVRAITVSPDGRIWVGYPGSGVDVFSPPLAGQSRLNAVPLDGTENFYIQGLVAHGDKLWVLSTSDLYRYSTRTDALELTYDLFQFGQPSDRSHHLMDVAADGTLWLGTIGGVRLYHPDGSTQTFTMANSPLADNDVRSIRVDPVTGVGWIGTAAGLSRFDPSYVAPPPPPLAALDIQVFPNPASLSAIGTRVQLRGNASVYRGRIVDLGGRTVRRFSAAANGQVVWDGRDSGGQIVRPGVYFVEVEAGGRRGVTRIALVR